jgi:hypothetical protein
MNIIIECLNLCYMVKAELYNMKINKMIFYEIRPIRDMSLLLYRIFYVYIRWIILLNIFFDDYNYRDSASSINLDLEELGFIKDEV